MSGRVYSVQIGDQALVDVAEIDKLRTRIKDLEQALADTLAGLAYVRQNHGELYGVGFDRCEAYRPLIQGCSKDFLYDRKLHSLPE